MFEFRFGNAVISCINSQIKPKINVSWKLHTHVAHFSTSLHFHHFYISFLPTVQCFKFAHEAKKGHLFRLKATTSYKSCHAFVWPSLKNAQVFSQLQKTRNWRSLWWSKLSLISAKPQNFSFFWTNIAQKLKFLVPPRTKKNKRFLFCAQKQNNMNWNFLCTKQNKTKRIWTERTKQEQNKTENARTKTRLVWSTLPRHVLTWSAKNAAQTLGIVKRSEWACLDWTKNPNLDAARITVAPTFESEQVQLVELRSLSQQPPQSEQHWPRNSLNLATLPKNSNLDAGKVAVTLTQWLAE